MKHVSVELIQGFGGKGCVFEFDKTHGSILLGAETESLVSTLLGKDSLEFIFRRVHGKIAHVESVAWWILISRVYWGVSGPRKVLRVLLVACIGSAAQCGGNTMW